MRKQIMKINISRQNIFLLVMATVLLLFVLLFSFIALIPKGKEYREQRTDLRKVQRELKRHEDFNDMTFEELKKLQSDSRHIIEAFDATFSAQRFELQNKSYFNSLTLSKISQRTDEDGFAVYEVNTTSQINSPKVFYDFLDAINKGDWIIGINFPISFKRENDLIRSTFTMKVYCTKDDSPESNNTVDANATAL